MSSEVTGDQRGGLPCDIRSVLFQACCWQNVFLLCRISRLGQLQYLLTEMLSAQDRRTSCHRDNVKVRMTVASSWITQALLTQGLSNATEQFSLQPSELTSSLTLPGLSLHEKAMLATSVP